MFFYIVLTQIFTTSSLQSTGNMRKYQQIDVYIYQCANAFKDSAVVKTQKLFLSHRGFLTYPVYHLGETFKSLTMI